MRQLYKLETPWGVAQSVKTIAPGIELIETAGHGGFRLSPERRQEMPEQYRNQQIFAGGNWYEEDCDAALVVASFPQFFKPETVQHCKEYLQSKI
jgi:hypothetical protein